MSKNQASKPLEIKISTVVAVAALLGETDLATLSASLKQITGGTADYFDDDFALLDFGPTTPAPLPGSIDWPKLIALFRSHRLNPVAVRNAPAALEDEIRRHGLSIDTMQQTRQAEPAPQAAAPAPEAQVAAAPATAPVTPSASMIIDTPVRGGQRIYARGCDLILMGVVNHGAEVIADGSIHVYAPLRGRALAGASGNAQARIFSLAMQAELISIAGVYRTFDAGWTKDLAKHPVQVRLIDDRLDLTAIASK